MFSTVDIEKLIKDLEEKYDHCSPDKYGYIESDVYKYVIKKLKEAEIHYLDVEKYYEEEK